MLAFEVEFLLGRYVATDFRDREQTEWPPHPSRLFSAMVAAAYSAGLGESVRAALLWLESLPAPCLRAEEAPGVQSPVTVFVPVNDPTGAPLPQRAERQPRTFPSVVPHEQAVWFIWPDAEPDATLEGLLDLVARHVTYLGSSRSPVRVRRGEEPPEPNWFPDDEGELLLRVPAKGRLERLDWHYANGQRPPAGAFQRYTFGRREATIDHASAFDDDMVVFRLEGPVNMEVETTLKLTGALRAAVMRKAQDVLGLVPELLSGHAEENRPSKRPHAAYLALPFVSHSEQHADGHVLGVAVAFPRGIDKQERRQAVRALVSLDHLLVPGVGRFELSRPTAGKPVQHNLRPSTWEGPSRRWDSVTPVLLDRFPKRGGRGLGAILARGCEHVGLPPPVEVTIDRYSPMFGVPPSFAFVTQRGAEGEKPRLYTHASFTFERPVRGPILLGAGRHFGLGLLRPSPEGGAP